MGADGEPLAEVYAGGYPIVGGPTGGDAVQVRFIDPPDGTQMIAGTTLFVTAEIEYTLSSRGSGEVVLLFGDEQHRQFASFTVNAGSGVVTLEGSFVIPNLSGTEIQVLLMGADGEPLAQFRAAADPIVGGPTGGDFVQVRFIDPPNGTEMIAGTTVGVNVGVKYGLSSRGSGEVALLVQVTEQFHDTFSSVPVRAENELVTLEGNFVVPNRPGTQIVVHLRGEDGELLAEVRAAQYKIVQQPLGPVAAGGDDIEAVKIDPPGGTPLEPGTGVEITAVVQYTLSSQPSGFVRMGYVPSDGGFSQIAEQPVVRGSDSITFRAGLTVPDQPTIRLFVSLAGADGGPILSMEIAAYPRSQVAQPVPAPTGQGRHGGELRIVLGGDPAAGNNPFDPFRRPAFRLIQAISPAFNGLVEQDPQDPYNIVRGLAERWDISSDGTGWTFTLRQGVEFHNGQRLITGDVVETFAYILDNGAPFVRDDLARCFMKRLSCRRDE